MFQEPLIYARNLLRGNQYVHEENDSRPGLDLPPVLVLHGYLGTRGAMYLIERRLLRDGFTVFSFPLGIVNTADIRKSAVRVQEQVSRMLAESRVPRIDIVAHSMGGLIGLHYIQELGGADRVRRLITLGTPYRGTWTAYVGIAMIGLVAPSSWQLIPNSRFVRELTSRPLPPDLQVCSIRGRYDLICPLPSSHLPGAKEVILPVSHSGLVSEAGPYQAILRCLTEP